MVCHSIVYSVITRHYDLIDIRITKGTTVVCLPRFSNVNFMYFYTQQLFAPGPRCDQVALYSTATWSPVIFAIIYSESVR